jgi:hypothetical protein
MAERKMKKKAPKGRELKIGKRGGKGEIFRLAKFVVAIRGRPAKKSLFRHDNRSFAFI